MAGVRLLVIYPRPKDVAVFEREYTEKHLPLAAKKIPAKTKFVTNEGAGYSNWGDTALLSHR